MAISHDPLIKAYEATKPKQHPVGMTVAVAGRVERELYASHADLDFTVRRT